MIFFGAFEGFAESRELEAFYEEGMKVEYAGWLVVPFVFVAVVLLPLPSRLRPAWAVLQAASVGVAGGLLAWYFDLLIKSLHDIALIVGVFSFVAALLAGTPLGNQRSRSPQTP